MTAENSALPYYHIIDYPNICKHTHSQKEPSYMRFLVL